MTGSSSTVIWHGHPQAPAPLHAIHKARKHHAQVTVVDDAGRAVPYGPGTLLREIVRRVWQRGLDLLVEGCATLLAGRRSPPLRADRGDPAGPVVLVLPVLPDLSHTFVYREVLAILQQRPAWRVVVLARNDRAPVHAEARELLARATFLVRDGVTMRALRMLRWLLQPAGRELFALYRAQPGGRAHDLLGKNPLREPRHPGNAFELADQLAALRPSALHVYSSTWPANVALGAAHLLAVPFSISSYVDFEFPYAFPMLAEKVARARFFRVVTAYCKAQLLAQPGLPTAPPPRVPVVLLGLDLDNWQAQAVPSGRGVLVSAARLVPKKGLHHVPPALAALRARGIPFRWRIVGEGPEQARIAAACAEHGIADAVDFLGACDNATVRTELLAADAALLPCVVAHDGERDGIPIFLCEAMALGVPVVSTPVSGIPELVRDGDTGFLAAAGDSDSLAAVLARVLTDAALAQQIGQRGRAAVRRELDVRDRARDLIVEIER